MMITRVVAVLRIHGWHRGRPSIATGDRQWQWDTVRHYVPVMVKTLFLGLLAASICGFLYAAPAAEPYTNSKLPLTLDNSSSSSSDDSPLEDPAARSERSTNLSHVTGTARKIQMFIKNRHLQILPDGTVNGTTDDTSAYCESKFFSHHITPLQQFFFQIYPRHT